MNVTEAGRNGRVTVGRWGMHGDLIREFRRAGINAEDAVTAARIAENVLRERRDWMIRAGRATGASLRALARFWDVSHTHVRRVTRGLEPDALRHVPAIGATVPATKDQKD